MIQQPTPIFEDIISLAKHILHLKIVKIEFAKQINDLPSPIKRYLTALDTLDQ